MGEPHIAATNAQVLTFQMGILALELLQDCPETITKLGFDTDRM